MKTRKDKKIKSLDILKLTVEVSISLIPVVGTTLIAMTGLMDVINKIEQEKERIEKIIGVASKESQKSKSIVEMMVDDREKNSRIAYILLSITLLGQFALAYLSKSELSIWLTTLILFLAGAIYINQTIFEYRARKGLYGNTDYEAREILGFIFENAEYIDFGDGNGAKRISPEPERETQENIIPEGGVVA